MRPVLLSFFVLLAAPAAFAQESTPPLVGHREAVQVSILPVIQVWEDAEAEDYFGQLSVPLAVHLPLGRRVSLSLRASGAAADGTHLEPLGGLADIQAAVNVRQEVGRAVLLASLGASLPSGKKELTNDEFSTSYVLGQNIFRFQVPSLGQGVGLTPGLLLVVPVTDRFVVGVGGGYQFKGPYRPLESFEADYDPGDEVLLTGGFDVRLGPTTYFSSDATYAMYGRDLLGEEEVFGSGAKVVANAQFRHYVGFHELWLLGRFRSKGKNEIPVGGLLVEEAEKSTPDQVEVMGHFRIRFGGGFYTRLLAEARFFDASPTASSLTLYGVGIGPEVVIGQAVAIPLRLKYYFGDFRGGEASLGLTVGL